jgi:hypothetical protein
MRVDRKGYCAMAGMWRLKLLGYNDAIEDDCLFRDLKALLESARSIATARPDLRLVQTVPADALKNDRDWVRQIANRVNLASDDAIESTGIQHISSSAKRRCRFASTEVKRSVAEDDLSSRTCSGRLFF